MPQSPEDQMLRDEHFQQLTEEQSKVKLLDEIIAEGVKAEDFVNNHPFYPIFKRTFTALRESYNADAHKASRDSRSEISHFLGREEAIRDLFSILGDFTVKADSAEEEKKVALDRIKELQSILGSAEGDTSGLADLGGSL